MRRQRPALDFSDDPKIKDSSHHRNLEQRNRGGCARDEGQAARQTLSSEAMGNLKVLAI